MKLILNFLVALCISSTVFGQQKIAYYDSSVLLDQIPEVKDVQSKLDQLANEWRNDITKMKRDLDDAFKQFRSQMLLYSDDIRKQKEDEIIKMEQTISDYQNKKFGVNGELFQRQGDLMKPIQNSIFKAIQKIAEEQKYDFVFDRSGQVMMAYANPTFNLTDEILRRVRVTGIDSK